MRERRGASRKLLGVVVAVLGVAAACSANKGVGPAARGSNNGSAGSGASAGSGLVIGAGTSGILNPSSGGSGGLPPVMLARCSASMACSADDICVATTMGHGSCSPKGATCTADKDCQNDTYCCSGSCRLDGAADGVCVVGDTRPTNDSCTTKLNVGVFAPNLQCQWSGPDATDPFPKHAQVLTTPLVADLPNDSGTAAEIIFVASDSTAGAEVGDGTGGRIRILNGQTCKQDEVITAGPAVRDAATPAIGDLDGDGKPEIVAHESFGAGNDKIVAFTWKVDHYDVMWETTTGLATSDPGAWDGVSLHDLNNDGKAEVIGRGGEVFDGVTGKQIAAGGGDVILISDPVLGDVDHDGTVDLVANEVFSWNGSGWTKKYPGLGATSQAQVGLFYAFADFGTRHADGSFDHTKKDGIAEIVVTGPLGGDASTGMVGIYTLQGEPLLRVDLAQPVGASCTSIDHGQRGGPPTIGDFDGDGMPELASAGAYAYRVFDLDCKDPGQNCQDPTNFIRWAQDSQDCTSGTTGSTIFDFEGDGSAEAIYGDECFERVYDGKTGEVLFSTYHSSATWWESPIVADPDHSDRSKLIFGGSSNANVFTTCGPGTSEDRNPPDPDSRKNGKVDKIYKGLRCLTNADCPSMNCDTGFCRCATDLDCGNTWSAPISDGNDRESGLVCTSPIAGTPGTGNVCRMQHGSVDTVAVANKYFTGVFVYRDVLDRWASSRSMWNQHAYSITNINDDGTIPKTSDWLQNFLDPTLNNYRQNKQGSTSADLADITGALDPANACTATADGGILFTGKICNRGLRGVGANLPAAFYVGVGAGDGGTADGGAAVLGKPVCQTTSNGPVPVGGCASITCEVPGMDVSGGSTITMVANDAGGGTRLVDECNYDNNTSSVVIQSCAVVK
jgi:hypothetical protein